jgi:uncharacterized protein (DUF1800 family)
MNRRTFLTLGTPTSRHASEAQIPSQAAGALDRWIPSASEAWDYAKAAHLLRRAMVGPTDAEIRRAVAEGLDATMARLLTPFEPSFYLIDEWVHDDKFVYFAPEEGPLLEAWFVEKRLRRERLGRWWLKTIVESPVSIQERMAIFWHSHFVSDVRVVENAEWMYPQIALFRTNALGNFKEMAREVSRGLAMLKYLDGVESYIGDTESHINENYARELMELFTMGVNDWDGKANYTQADVAEVSRALSGWTRRPSDHGAPYSDIVSTFVPERWDPGIKTFLGRTGTFGLDDVIEIIFTERADQVAKFICGKLYQLFVYETPDRDVVAAMASLLRASDWEIRPVVESLLTSAHFYDPTNIGAIPKNMIDFYVGLVRGLAVGAVDDFVVETEYPHNSLTVRLLKAGQMLLYPPNVKGWPGGRTWVSSAMLPMRQKFAVDVADERIDFWWKGKATKQFTIDPIAIARSFPSPNDIHALAADMTQYLLPMAPTDRERERLFQALLDGGVDYEWSLDDPEQSAGKRIRKFLRTAFQLAKYQLY